MLFGAQKKEGSLQIDDRQANKRVQAEQQTFQKVVQLKSVIQRIFSTPTPVF